MKDHKDQIQDAADPAKKDTGSPDVRLESFRKETASKAGHQPRQEAHRSGMNMPVDPNALTADVEIPPGIHPDDLDDPGRATPGSGTVDDRRGKKES